MSPHWSRLFRKMKRPRIARDVETGRVLQRAVVQVQDNSDSRRIHAGHISRKFGKSRKIVENKTMK